MKYFDGSYDGEEWLPVKDLPRYEVSNFGRIRTKETVTIGSRGREFVNHSKLLTFKERKGRGKQQTNYYQVRLTDENGNKKTYYVHRLVALAFIDNPENKPTVNHIDGNKLNNHVSNLEWATYGENNLHAYKNSLKEDNKKIICINTQTNKVIGSYYSISEAHNLTDIERTTIHKMLENKYEYNNMKFIYLADFCNNYYVIEDKKEIADMEQIKIKYFDKEVDKLEKINVGDLIDLRSAETVELKKGDFKLIKLGVAMQLPEGYEAHVYPRSSTYRNFGVIQANSVGLIDNSYCGDNDQWMFPAIALRDTVIHKNDRICQFRIVKNQPALEFIEVDALGNEDRKGIGSTGVN